MSLADTIHWRPNSLEEHKYLAEYLHSANIGRGYYRACGQRAAEGHISRGGLGFRTADIERYTYRRPSLLPHTCRAALPAVYVLLLSAAVCPLLALFAYASLCSRFPCDPSVSFVVFLDVLPFTIFAPPIFFPFIFNKCEVLF